MAFLKFSRDRRGYEHFYLVEPMTERRGRSNPRIIYWFRTPPNVKVGRQPFSEDVRRQLEAQNPQVTFDWDKLVATPIPPPEPVEPWRERRRLARTARAVPEPGLVIEEDQAAVEQVPSEEAPVDDLEEALSAGEAALEVPGEGAAATPDRPERPAIQGTPQPHARRRRRRRRGGHRNHADTTGGPKSVPAETAPVDEDASPAPSAEPPEGE